MAKFLYLATIFFIIGLSLADHKSHFPWFPAFFRPFITPTSICANNGSQTPYLTKMLVLINNYQLNSTYNPVLQLESPNVVSYIKNSTNQGLFYSNCTAFITGLKKAKVADKTAERTRQRISAEIHYRFRQVTRDVTGSNRPNELDSSELYGYPY